MGVGQFRGPLKDSLVCLREVAEAAEVLAEFMALTGADGLPDEWFNGGSIFLWAITEGNDFDCCNK